MRRFVPNWQIHLLRKRSDIGLRESCFYHGTSDGEIARRFQTGPEIAEIVSVRAVCDLVPTLGSSDIDQVGVQLSLAEEAALKVIGRVTGIVDLVCDDYAMVPGLLFRKINGIYELIFGQTRGVGGDGDRFVAERLLCDGGQESAVYAPGIRHDQRAVTAQYLGQARPFFGQRQFSCWAHRSRRGARHRSLLRISGVVDPDFKRSGRIPLSIPRSVTR